MKKSLTIFCEETKDQEFEYQPQKEKNQRKVNALYQKTIKKSNFINNSTTCQTPQAKNNPKQSYQFKSPKYVGIIQKNVLQRLKIYEQKQKDKMQTQNVSTKVKQQEYAIKQLKQKPEINPISKQLFEKVKKQKRLSPNILQRFKTYQCQRVSKMAKYDLMKAQGMEIKNTTFYCRKNRNESSKSRSPLREFQLNVNRNKSKSATNFPKSVRNSEKVGHIVFRKKKCQNENQNQTKKTQQQSYCSLFPHNECRRQKQAKIKGDVSPARVKTELVQKYQTDSLQYRLISPITLKNDNQNNRKWKVLI